MKKEKVSITLQPNVLSNVDMERQRLGLSRSAFINMRLRRRK